VDEGIKARNKAFALADVRRFFNFLISAKFPISAGKEVTQEKRNHREESFPK
jgi:hypothetical protein